MENNLIQTAQSYFSEQRYNDLASQENVTVEQAKNGIAAIIPSLFLGFQRKSGPELNGLLEKVKSGLSGFDFSNMLNFGSSEENAGENVDSTKSFLGSLFGDGFDGILSNLSNFLGINTNSVVRLFSAGAPAVIGALTSNGERWDTTSIGADLNNNRSNFLSALPAGLTLGLFGNDAGSHERPVDPIVPSEPRKEPIEPVVPAKPIVPTEPRTESKYVPPTTLPPVEEKRKKGGGFWWIIILLLLILLWFLFGRGCSGNDTTTSDSTNTDTMGINMDSQSPAPMDSSLDEPAVRESIMVTLPNDETLDAYKGGIEDQLVNFLNSDYKSLSEDELKNRWFDFDNLNFQTGTSNILPESQVQVDNLAAILDAFPDAKIKVGGYTDKTGTEEINKKLSNDRAAAVQKALELKGVGDRVVETEGYGSDFAEFSPDAPESDRVKDRRVAISVRK